MNKGPLMFIETVGNDTEPNQQEIFDSRYPFEMIRCKEIKKLQNIVDLFKKQRPVFCRINTKEKETEGIPFRLKDNLLSYLTLDGKTEDIHIELIQSIRIIRFSKEYN